MEKKRKSLVSILREVFPPNSKEDISHKKTQDTKGKFPN